MAKKVGMAFMMEFVQEYLDGKSDRLGFDLDFNHYLIQLYPRMERQNAELAESFSFYMGEMGFDRVNGLSDAKHKALIRKQYAKFLAAMNDDLL